MQNRAAEIQQNAVAAKFSHMKQVSEMVDKLSDSGDYSSAAAMAGLIDGKPHDPEEIKKNRQLAVTRSNPALMAEFAKQGNFRPYIEHAYPQATAEQKDAIESMLRSQWEAYEQRKDDRSNALILGRQSLANELSEERAWEALAKAEDQKAEDEYKRRTITGATPQDAEKMAKPYRDQAAEYRNKKPSMKRVASAAPPKPIAVPEIFPSSVSELQKVMKKGVVVTQEIYDMMKEAWMAKRNEQ